LYLRGGGRLEIGKAKEDSLYIVARVARRLFATAEDTSLPQVILLGSLPLPAINSHHHLLDLVQARSARRIDSEHVEENVDRVEGEGSEVEEERTRISTEREGATSESAFPSEKCEKRKEARESGERTERKRNDEDDTRNETKNSRKSSSVQHHQQNHPQPPDVVINGIVRQSEREPLRLALWTHEPLRSMPKLVRLLVPRSEPPIRQLSVERPLSSLLVPMLSQEDVLRFEISVCDVAVVRVGDGVDELEED